MSTPSRCEAHLFARIAQDLNDQPSIDATTQRIAELAKTILGCDAAGVWRMSNGGSPQVVAASGDEIVSAVHAIVAAIHQGTAYQCLRDETTIRVDDVGTDARWPEYAERVQAAGLGIRSVAAYPLRSADSGLGALVLYSRQVGFFTQEAAELGSVLACHASLALHGAYTADKAEQLVKALETSRQIGTALGILMTAYRITSDAAFDLLRAASQNCHRKLRDVADEVVLTGAIPEWRSEAT